MQSTYNVTEKYSKGSRILHWLIALMVICLLLMGFLLDDIPKTMKPMAYMLHKSCGITIIFLMIIRIFWLSRTGKPKLPSSVPTWQRVAARGVQYGFYLLLFVMPLAGWIMSMAADKTPVYFGLFPFPLPGIQPNEELAKTMVQIHNIVGWLLVILITAHVLGAIKHYFVDKDGVVNKMI